MDVKQLEELLTSKLGTNRKIINARTSKNCIQGAGSIMLNIEVNHRNKHDEENVLHLVAKQISASEIAKQIFNFQVSFKKEVAFYEVIVPILKKFQNEKCPDYSLDFAEFYGARYNLNGNKIKVDDDALLLLENLSDKGM